MTIPDIVKQHFPYRTKSSIATRAHTLGLKSNRSLMKKLQGPRYTCNYNFFNEVNPISCYWAGFLAADGNIYYHRNKESCRLNCTIKDKGHLEKFKTALLATHPIHQYNGYCKETENTVFYHLNIDSARVIADGLKQNFNIVPNKSLILEPPAINDEECIKCFIRGYFDGDGYITQYKNNVQIGFAGTQQMLSWIREKFIQYLGCRPGSLVPERSIYRLRFGGSRSSYQILSWLYNGSTPMDRLDRKYERFIVYYNKALQ